VPLASNLPPARGSFDVYTVFFQLLIRPSYSHHRWGGESSKTGKNATRSKLSREENSKGEGTEVPPIKDTQSTVSVMIGVFAGYLYPLRKDPLAGECGVPPLATESVEADAFAVASLPGRC
jgi:hypothetical protein